MSVRLRQIVRRNIRTAFAQAKDIAVDITFTVKAAITDNHVYDPVTGRPSNTSDTSFVVSEALLVAYKARDIDGTVVQIGDQRALVPTYKLRGHVPAMKDEIRVDGGAGDPRNGVWHIVKLDVDPTGELWTLQVRR